MLSPREVLKLVVGRPETAASFLARSGVQFQVRVHPNWCVYDAAKHTLVDPSQENAVVPTLIEDIIAIRFDGGDPIPIEQGELVA